MRLLSSRRADGSTGRAPGSVAVCGRGTHGLQVYTTHDLRLRGSEPADRITVELSMFKRCQPGTAAGLPKFIVTLKFGLASHQTWKVSKD
eukprot:756319-Hanusia_phi.AAC.2